MSYFVLGLLANLAWMALEGHRGFGAWMLFNVALLVALVIGQALLMLTCLAVGVAADRRGWLRVGLAAYRWGGRLAGPGAFGFRVNEMALRTRYEDYAGADALWAAVEPELGRPDTCATHAVGVRAAALVNRGRLAEGLAITAGPDDSPAVRGRRDFATVDALRLGNRVSALMGVGRFDEAALALAQARERAGSHPQIGPVLRLNEAWLALHQGRPGDIRLQDDPPESGWALLLARLGEVDRAAALPLGGLVAPPGTVRARYVEEMVRGYVAWHRGDRPEAERRFLAAAALPTPPGEEMLEAWRLTGLEPLRTALRERSPESVWTQRALDQGSAPEAEGILAS